MPNGKRVVVAMSGGVDSSVAAALLVSQNYEVIGVTLNVWPDADHVAREDACCSLSAVEDARRVAAKLGIDHYTLNFREVFRRAVIEDFVSEYRQGRTPNPCIRCNEFVKFSGLLHRTHGLDADYVATGHYARIIYDRKTAQYELRKARDLHKDQSYVLYVLDQQMLERTMMPLGNMSKAEVRDLAGQLGLPVAQKPESQEICFVPDNNYGRFLERLDPGCARPGPIIDQRGRQIGQHRGIVHYTIGQRRGLGVTVGAPLYVTAIDAARNTIVVGTDADLLTCEVVADHVNLISLAWLQRPTRVAARIRYRAKEMPASAQMRADGSLGIIFDEPQRAVTPGQAVVCYDGDLVIGGGTIVANRMRTDANCPTAG